MKSEKYLNPIFFLILLSIFLSACASTGPSLSKEEKKTNEKQFNAKFLKASENWLPKVYRIGYKLVSAHVPGHGEDKPDYRFIGVGAQELKDYARETYGIEKSVKGVLLLGTYPGSAAEHLDIKAGDVLQSLDGKKVKSVGSFFKVMRKSDGKVLKAVIWRHGSTVKMDFPVEKVYYNAQFFLAPTPNLDANALFSKINVGIGAIRYCRNDDELAVIMGHELAHTTLHHSLKKMGTGIGTSVGYGVAAAAINAVTIGGGGNLVVQPMQQATDAAVSRRYEKEADYFGMKHAFHAGYNVENGSKVFSRMATDAPGFGILSYTFASHPKSAERFLRLEKINEEFKTKYPEKFPQQPSPVWEMLVPVHGGETLTEALERLTMQAKKVQQAEVVPKPDSKTIPQAIAA